MKKAYTVQYFIQRVCARRRPCVIRQLPTRRLCLYTAAATHVFLRVAGADGLVGHVSGVERPQHVAKHAQEEIAQHLEPIITAILRVSFLF